MNMKSILTRGLSMCLIIVIASFYNTARAQVDTAKVTQPDTTVQEKDKKDKKNDKKRKDEFILYAGVNFDRLSLPESEYEATMEVGYQLGAAYKRGKFFYWQVGARYNNAVYGVKVMNGAIDTSYTLAVRDIDIPLTAGINLLSATNRILALRLFVSAVPAFTLGVGDNDYGIKKEDISSFILYGQGGIGVNVAFVVLEVG